jgi:hypothetical protein
MLAGAAQRSGFAMAPTIWRGCAGVEVGRRGVGTLRFEVDSARSAERATIARMIANRVTG